LHRTAFERHVREPIKDDILTLLVEGEDVGRLISGSDIHGQGDALPGAVCESVIH
jgi:hypothetical protein